jgi:molybdopterin synthase catalytic subunit
MRVTVKLFAVLRERAGVGEVMLELAGGATVADAAGEMVRKFPAIEELVGKSAYAVNREYAAAATVLREGDELALIPAVSGG